MASLLIRRALRFHLRTIAKLAITLCVAVNLLLLVFLSPRMLTEVCPSLSGKETKRSGFVSPRQVDPISAARQVSCRALYNSNGTFSSHANGSQRYTWCQRPDARSDHDYLALTENCDAFRAFRGYYDASHVSEEEMRFPLAFSILMHEHVEQAERLLRAIYQPHNVYCIHVDAKAPLSIRQAMTAIVNCLPNVFLPSRSLYVSWAEFTVLEAELLCLEELWRQHKDWQYYINLSGREFPLKTNLELVRILKVYNGGNEVDGSINKRPREWTDYSWRTQYWRTSSKKPPAPHGFHVAKGSTHVAVSRSFVDFALHDQRARDLLDWMKDVRCPDEHFFPTLNNNPHLGVPGAYTGNPDLRDGFYVRFKLWQSDQDTCHGKWVRFVCVLGSGDLHRLRDAKHMFVNKLDLDMDPVAFQCVEQMYFERTERNRNDESNSDFDIEFYKSRKLVKNHV